MEVLGVNLAVVDWCSRSSGDIAGDGSGGVVGVDAKDLQFAGVATGNGERLCCRDVTGAGGSWE